MTKIQTKYTAQIHCHFGSCSSHIHAVKQWDHMIFTVAFLCGHWILVQNSTANQLLKLLLQNSHFLLYFLRIWAHKLISNCWYFIFDLSPQVEQRNHKLLIMWQSACWVWVPHHFWEPVAEFLLKVSGESGLVWHACSNSCQTHSLVSSRISVKIGLCRWEMRNSGVQW